MDPRGLAARFRRHEVMQANQGLAPQWLSNASSSPQSGMSSDTYLLGSAIDLSRVKQGTSYVLRFDVTKTAAGIAAPVLTLRVGPNGAVSDAARAVITFDAQTAVADTGFVEFVATFRSVGSSAVVQCAAKLIHNLSITGLSVSATKTVLATSAPFSVSGKIGVSLNAGLLASWTIQLVQAELINLA